MVEDGYEFFAKRQLVTLFSAPNYCGEFDNAGAMMSVDETLMCSFQILKVSLCVCGHSVEESLWPVIRFSANLGTDERQFISFNKCYWSYIKACCLPQPADKKKFSYVMGTSRPVTPPRGAANQKAKKK